MQKPMIYYYDDQELQAEGTKVILEASGRVTVDVRPLPSLDSTKILDVLPDLFLVDYELDMKQSDGAQASYLGGTLTARLRESAREHPFVLLSRPSIVDPRKKQILRTQLGIDEILYKDQIAEHPAWAVSELVNLAQGFHLLRDIPLSQRDWGHLLQSLNARPDEADLLRKAAPPLFIIDGQSQWAVSQAADWIRCTLLAYPGILYDSVYAATELRISVKDFLSNGVQEVVGSAKYTGIFDPLEGRWWKERLWEAAMQYVGDTEFAGKFAAVFRERTGHELEPARSIVGDEVPADTVCYIYHEPVMYKYTVAYRPDNRLPVMDQARVSFKAIQQSNQVQPALLEGVSDEWLQAIREMTL